MHKDYLIWKERKVQLQRQKFYRKIAVFVEPNGQLRLKSAALVPKKALLKFLEQNKDWIEKRLQQVDLWKEKFPPYHYQWGEKVPLLGFHVKLTAGDVKRVQIKGSELLLPKGTKDLKSGLLKAYRILAEEYLPKRLAYWTDKTSLNPKGLKIRSYRARWGACASDGTISLNWKLMAAPKSVIDYVIIHELSHLRQMNHSQKFWDLVEDIDPKYRQHKVWLRENTFYFDFLEKESQLYS